METIRNKVKVIKDGMLIDGTGKDPIENAVILVEGSRIKEVGEKKEVRIPTNARIIEGGGKTILPGLMDLHVHITPLNGPRDPTRAQSVEQPCPDISTQKARYWKLYQTPSNLWVLYGAYHAKKYLEAGFTTIRSLPTFTNSRNREGIALKKAIELELVPGPRIMCASDVGCTSSHIDYNTPITWPRSPEDSADGVTEIRKRVRECVRERVDWIKTHASGSPVLKDTADWRNYTLEEFKALVDEAHAWGKKVAVHCHGYQGAKNVIEAGVDTIEHGTALDDDDLEAMIEKSIILVPTIYVYKIFLSMYPNRSTEGLRDMRYFRRAHERGVKIAMGTDMSITAPNHGDNAVELELMVKYGMTEMEAIVASTKNSAEALGLENQFGTIEKNKVADIIIVEGNPLKDIKILQDKKNIRKVIKNGEIVVDREITTKD